jgi:UDP-glucuronate 4-epimerase
MALFKFAQAIVAGDKLPVYNAGRMVRDFTYIDDVVEAVVRLLALPPGEDEGDGITDAPYRIFNIGYGRQIELLDYIRALEDAFGRGADRSYCRCSRATWLPLWRM